MADSNQKLNHAAPGSAIGFFYQSYYSLLALIKAGSDSAAIGIELLDDIQLSDGTSEVLHQLKHSMLTKPKKVSIKSTVLWKTLAAWIDVLGKVDLNQTRFLLVTVAGVDSSSTLNLLSTSGTTRATLISELDVEATRVINERLDAIKNKKKPPHSDRLAGCQAWLALSSREKKKFVAKIELKASSSSIGSLEEDIADALTILPKIQRGKIAIRLIQWWEREIVRSLCGKRKRVIEMTEVQQVILELSKEFADGKLKANFETTFPPSSHKPDGMIAKQILLVNGTKTHITMAVRDEWRARAERSNWINDRPDMATAIDDYDLRLIQRWQDKHGVMVDSCVNQNEDQKCVRGLELLTWIHEEAANKIAPLKEGYVSSYYVCGTYHTLASSLKVGWHPEYKNRLKEQS